MRTPATFLVAVTLLLAAAAARAQEDSSPYEPTRQDALGTRLVNLPTPLTVGAHTFELLFTHRFQESVRDGDAHNLWGLDSGADVGLGFAYGVSRNFDLSLYRSSVEEDFELAAKVALYRQAPRVPFSIALRAGADLLGSKRESDRSRPFAQAILSRQFAPGWNLMLVPTWVRDTPRLRNATNLGVGLSAPLPHGTLLDVEVLPRNHDLPGSVTAWSVALSKAVGGHLFKITLGNSRATTVDQYTGGDFSGGFKTGDVRLGFNLVRNFHL